METENRIALVGIIAENEESVERLNAELHEAAKFIVGRMGIPHRERGLYVICITLDAPMDEINALSGALGRLEGVSAKASLAKH